MDLQNCEYTKVNTRAEEDGKEDEKPSTKETNVSYFELYKFATPFDKFLIAIGVITSVFGGLTASSTYYITGVAVDAVVQFGYDLNKYPNEILKAEETLMSTMHRFLIYTVVTLTISLACTYITTFVFNYTALNQVFRIRELYFFSLLNQDIGWHDQNQTGDFASRNTDDLKKLQDSIGEKASMFIFTTVHILSGIAIAFYLGWELTLISSIPFPIIFFITWYVGKVSSNLSEKECELFGEASVVAEETLTGIKTVVAFEGQEAEKKRYTGLLKSALVNNVKRYRYIAFNKGVTDSFAYITCGLTFWYGIKLVLKDRESSVDGYNTQDVVAILLALSSAYYYIGTLLPLLEVLTIGKAAASKIFQVICTEPSINKSYDKGRKLNDLQGNINFHKVCFSYPARKDIKVLQELSFSINSGQTVALVGGSGCGKSTCIQLLQRLYDPDLGKILVDDVALPDLDLTWWRSQIGVVNQEPVLFEATIAQNIRLGFLDATQKDVEEAAKKANAHDFISSFPEGYETVIGEGGAQLSGGQKQRIAIARALIRKPTILLLDEATSALDSESEALVQSALDSASKECTTIIVAHRLSTIKNADKIIFIGEGKAIEEGTHEELLASKGFYKQLVTTQFTHTEKQEVSNLDNQENNVHMFTEETKTTEIKEELKFRESYSIFRELIKVNQSEKWIILMGCLFAITLGSINCVWGFIFGNTVGGISEVDSDKARHLSNVNGLIFLMMGVVAAILTYFHVYLIAVAGERLVLKLRSLMFSSILGQEIAWFDKSENGVGAVGARLSGEISNIQGALGQKTSAVLTCIPSLVMIFIMGFILDYKLLLINLAFSPIIFLSVYFEYKLFEKESHIHSVMLEKSTKLGVEVINSIRTVAALSIENLALKLYLDTLTLYRRVAQQNAHVRGIVFGIARSSYQINYCISMYFGALLMKHGYVDSTSVLILSQTIVAGMFYVASGLAYSPNFTSGLTSFARILEVINRTPLIRNCTKEANKLVGDILYKEVEFAYPTRPNAKVLDKFNLSVVKGQTVALVGSSGCGKSTVIQLIERFYDATDGQITLGNQDISEINLTAHRMRLSLVSQEPNLFSRTIFENIAYGDNSRIVSGDEIIKAGQQASIHNFISSLPLGYDTPLGEKGTQLSGGQKQRIAIARALVRNPEVLLLDEATSALDAENERIVQEALDNAKEGRTCIMIAHNLKTIENANIIVVMSDGKVVEMGTHAELLNNRALYEKLYNARS